MRYNKANHNRGFMPKESKVKQTPEDKKIAAIVEVISDELFFSARELDHLENLYACCQDTETGVKIEGIKLEHKILNIMLEEIEEIKNPTNREPYDFFSPTFQQLSIFNLLK
jgi:hypothetical protein